MHEKINLDLTAHLSKHNVRHYQHINTAATVKCGIWFTDNETVFYDMTELSGRESAFVIRCFVNIIGVLIAVSETLLAPQRLIDSSKSFKLWDIELEEKSGKMRPTH